MIANTENPVQKNYPEDPNEAWVRQVLEEEAIPLSDLDQHLPYGRAELTPAKKALLWAMRAYVLLSFGAVAAQVYIALR